MEIPLHDLPQGGRRFEERWRRIDVREETGLRGLREVQVALLATGDRQRLRLAGEVDGVAELSCSRCLKEFDQSIHAPLNLTFALTTDILEEDLDVERLADGLYVDPRPEIIGTLLSELPYKTLCRTDCLGLCPECGADLNDGPCGCPRPGGSPFDILRTLKDEGGR
jgi:uncharacterized protein